VVARESGDRRTGGLLGVAIATNAMAYYLLQGIYKRNYKIPILRLYIYALDY
jgi:hypothetical protein